MQNEKSKLKNVLADFLGKQMQIPPRYSAKKVGGKKAYELARSGQKVSLKPQEIEIYDIKVVEIKNQNAKISDADIVLDIHCSSGTYIRSLVHDIGQRLGCGAYVEELTRVAIGYFEINEAVLLSDITPENWWQYLINFNTVLCCGTFEVLHKGHEFYLKEAKKLGKRLVVVVARDDTASKLRSRVLRYNENERLERVKTLPFVDEATLGGRGDPYFAVKDIKPDIIALGYDQKAFVKELPEKIKEFGLKTKTARIPSYHPNVFKSSLIQNKS